MEAKGPLISMEFFVVVLFLPRPFPLGMTRPRRTYLSSSSSSPPPPPVCQMEILANWNSQINLELDKLDLLYELDKLTSLACQA